MKEGVDSDDGEEDYGQNNKDSRRKNSKDELGLEGGGQVRPGGGASGCRDGGQGGRGAGTTDTVNRQADLPPLHRCGGSCHGHSGLDEDQVQALQLISRFRREQNSKKKKKVFVDGDGDSAQSAKSPRKHQGERRPFQYDPQRHWPGAGDLDQQLFSKSVSMKVSGYQRQGGRDILAPDLGVHTYATIVHANTGDVFYIGEGAGAIMNSKYRNPIKICQREMSALVNSHQQVVSAKDAMQRAWSGDHVSDEACIDSIAKATLAYREALSAATADLKAKNSEYIALARKRQTLEDGLKQYRANLEKVTSKFLASVGQGGLVLFATNLCDWKHSRGVNNGAISAMAFGQLRKRLDHDCAITGALLQLVREDRTSRWCVFCGKYNGSLGASRRFHCGNSNCLHSFGRDAGAALNIVFKYLMKRAQRHLPRVIAGAIANANATPEG
jgi:hypothetical protein